MNNRYYDKKIFDKEIKKYLIDIRTQKVKNILAYIKKKLVNLYYQLKD